MFLVNRGFIPVTHTHKIKPLRALLPRDIYDQLSCKKCPQGNKIQTSQKTYKVKTSSNSRSKCLLFAVFPDEIFIMPRGRNRHLESFSFNEVPKINVKMMIPILQVPIKGPTKGKKKEKKPPTSLTSPVIPLTMSALYKETDIRNVQSDEAQALSVQESLQL